ncbi:RidA family protein [Mycolicibacterium litorale]|uniref:Translation initiation inhibitor n=1 Tax=Mycolicibacterium litorale TaxID=758802 RepID=A0AAD1INF7_9MYCO|nr:RidA family protein [Mycolicibacterium litorale]MCV7415523.1 RidA family protein [Mycolicibacterium litorale]TDY08777.1 enamine deaminase RidA (YjgF/YER057c/UK114 family) [Mycolicibacterium litorale]BBY16702.1 translation initiation inhibitor [Mycolicibacterium litorale]
MTPRDRLAELGLELPAPPPPKGAYIPYRWCGDQLWVSGATARRPDAPSLRGVVGADVTVGDAAEQARLAALNLLGAVEAAAGLGAVRGLVHLRGYVRGTTDFDAHPVVVDGASELLIEVFGADRGAHARTAIGVASLPGGACVELELVAAVDR